MVFSIKPGFVSYSKSTKGVPAIVSFAFTERCSTDGFFCAFRKGAGSSCFNPPVAAGCSGLSGLTMRPGWLSKAGKANARGLCFGRAGDRRDGPCWGRGGRGAPHRGEFKTLNAA
jgi:hypothetical protein